eukprot:Gb_30364 [translate_table: standard]
MDCFSSAKDGESLPVLKVHSWDQVPLDLSEFKEASLSPTRDLLLLLTYQCEALLLPLVGSDLSKQFSSVTSQPLPVPSSQPASPKHSACFQMPVSSLPVYLDCESVEPIFYTPPSSQPRAFHSPHSMSLESTPFCTPLWTSLRSKSPICDTPSYISYEKPEMLPSYMDFPTGATENSSCSTSNPFPFISDVRSFAWGCSGDEYGAAKHSGFFKELLFVPGKHGVTVHAFCSKRSDNGRTNAGSNTTIEADGRKPFEVGKGAGRLANWGPPGVSLNACFADAVEVREECSSDSRYPDSFQEVNFRNGNRENSNTSSVGGMDMKDSNRSFTSKKWLQSFVMDIEMEECGGNFLAKFPVKSSFPSSAEVVSFCICFSSPALLHFVRSSGEAVSYAKEESQVTSSSFKKDLEGRETNQVLATESVQQHTFCSRDSSSSAASSEKISISEQFEQDKGNETNTAYECSKIFSSSSHRLLGMVLTEQNPVSEAVEKVHSKSELEHFVLVAMVHEWGIRWACSVDLQNSVLSPTAGNCWSAFQLADELLFGLKESGVIFIWAAMTGKLVGSIDVLHHCGLELNLSINEEKGFGESKFLQKDDIENSIISRVTTESTSEESEELHNMEISGQLRPGYCFTKLLVTANSLLIAVTDKYGSVFLISRDEYVEDLEFLPEKSVSLPEGFSFSDLSILSSWEIAGSDIGGQNRYWLKSFSERRGHSVGSSQTEEIAFRNNREIRMKSGGARVSSSSSGFMSSSHRKDGLIFSERRSVQPLRRVFLPSEKNDAGAIISLSPFGITKLVCAVNLEVGQKEFKIVQSSLRVPGTMLDDSGLDAKLKFTQRGCLEKESRFLGEVIGFCSQGCLYLVLQSGLHVVLPPISLSSRIMQDASRGQWWFSDISAGVVSTHCQSLVPVDNKGVLYQQWQIEVLDRALVYDGVKEAEHLSMENGWSLKTTRLRRLQLALDYWQSDEIEQALEALVAVNAAEEGVLRVLFTAVEQMLSKFGGDNELALASRLLALAARFATRIIRYYGNLEWKRRNQQLKIHGIQTEKILEWPLLSNTMLHEVDTSGRLREMAGFLEVIRNILDRLNAKRKRPKQGMREVGDELSSVLSDELQKSGLPPDSYEDSLQGGTLTKVEGMLQSVFVDQFCAEQYLLTSSGLDHLALSPLDNLASPASYLDSGSIQELSIRRSSEEGRSRRILPLENPKDMVRRWEVEQLDLTSVVKDALRSGRLPLAVLQLHRLHAKDSIKQTEFLDAFKEVQDVGKTIVYDLFCKGKTDLAIAALCRLGEDTEVSLRELAFGTVRRHLRTQVTEELKRYGHLGSRDLLILERVSLLERVYPSSSFWSTYGAYQRRLPINSLAGNHSKDATLHLICSSQQFKDHNIECGEIDGAVLGSWSSISTKEGFFAGSTQDNTSAGYWSGAAVWLDGWDQCTMDRIILDQPFFMGVHISWEAQFEYYVAHNDWEEVSKLLDTLPQSVLQEGKLYVQIDSKDSLVDEGGCSKHGRSGQEVDAIEMVIPRVMLLKVSIGHGCAMSMRKMIEEKLAESFIFLQAHWQGTREIMSLLARAGLIFRKLPTAKVNEKFSDLELSDVQYGEPHKDTVQAVHGLVLHHCRLYDLPHLLDIYLDHHALALDNTSTSLMRAVMGGCQWAEWLLLSRIKGCEYDASFSNAWSNLSRNVIPGRNLGVPEIEDLISTVDDMAETTGEIAALATLMYAPVPLQKCLYTGSVNKQRRTSSQCTLENLKSSLQMYSTLWRTLRAACFGQDPCNATLSPNAKTAVCKSGLTEYLNWREILFSSAGGDTSLLQMIPRWFPKGVKRLLQLSVQGPVGGQMLAGNVTVAGGISSHGPEVVGSDEIDALAWEVALQKNIEEELYASSFEEGDFGVEHHLHRGRALAAFNCLIGNRAQRRNSLGRVHQEHVGKSARGQIQAQASPEVQILLAPSTPSEEKLLISVTPLAIMHFENNVLVASCAFLLELCGLSANMLRVDVAALRRLSSFYQRLGHSEHSGLSKAREFTVFSSSFEEDVAGSLARALADEYVDAGMGILLEKQTDSSLKGAANQRPSRALTAVLQHLEKASLPEAFKGSSPGSWLLTGEGDGSQLRAQQRAASEHWSLVTTFCQMHHLPISTAYLATLAKDNDWVGFLAEAQFEGFPLDLLISVASKEFTDARLRSHILTVLKSMQSSRQKASSAANFPSSVTDSQLLGTSSINAMMPTELFGLLAECEKEKHAGRALLVEAKDLRWPLLAIVASCFPDVSSLSCLTVWLEITAARETSSIRVNDFAEQIATSVGAAVEATNALPNSSRVLSFRYNRKNPKRRRLAEPLSVGNTSDNDVNGASLNSSGPSGTSYISSTQGIGVSQLEQKQSTECVTATVDANQEQESLSKMVAVLCEQQLFLPLLRAFELFIPSCSLLPFIRFLQAFSQMRLAEASAHLASFSARLKEEAHAAQTTSSKGNKIATTWITSAAVKAADAMISTCPSAYEQRCLLQLLAAADFGDGGSAATRFRRLYWKIQLAEPALRQGAELILEGSKSDDGALLTALEKSGYWEEARSWARQLELSGPQWKSAVHHVTETQAEAMVSEWKEFLWDVPEEQAALWGHCQALFIKYSFPPLQAGMFFLKHAEAIDKEVPASELHGMLLLSLQWLSGSMTQSDPVYPLHLLREIETRVWHLAVESEVEMKTVKGLFQFPVMTKLSSRRSQEITTGNNVSVIDQTASIIAKMDSHLSGTRARNADQSESKEVTKLYSRHAQGVDTISPSVPANSSKLKRRGKGYVHHKRLPLDSAEKGQSDTEDNLPSAMAPGRSSDSVGIFPSQDENIKIEAAVAGWEERVGAAELERAVLALLEVGQIAAAKQLQQKLSPTHIPSELLLVEVALKIADISNPNAKGSITLSVTEPPAFALLQSLNLEEDINMGTSLQVLEAIATKCCEGCGKGLCKRIIAVVKIANFLELSFSEAFQKQPIELLQLLSLKAQDALEEAKLLVKTHSMPPASIARILAESFLKGLLAAHRGGYLDSSQREEGPAPLLWRSSDFMKWAELCPSEPDLGHALMRLVISGHDMPHACEVELLILAHHFYKSSACLDGVDVLVALAATRVESYVAEGDFSCLARLVTGVSNFQALYFMLDILIENGQLELLLQKYAVADAATESAEAIRGFRMTVLSALKHFNPDDLDAFAMVYNHFDMKHEMSALLESRAHRALDQWLLRHDREQSEDLLEMMRFYVEAAEVYSSIDAGNKTRWSCAQASLVSLQIRMPDTMWLKLTETNARRVLVEQSRFQEALIVAEAYSLNQPGEWVPVLWNQMLRPDLIDQFLTEFVSVLPLPATMLMELARFYRSEVTARGDQSHFSTWLTPGGLPLEWARHLGKSFRSLLKQTRDVRLRIQLATVATGFPDVIDTCMHILDKVPETAGPLILRKGHGGTYLPLM